MIRLVWSSGHSGTIGNCKPDDLDRIGTSGITGKSERVGAPLAFRGKL